MSHGVQRKFPSRSELVRIERRRDFGRALEDLVYQLGPSVSERGIFRDAVVAALGVVDARTAVFGSEDFLMLNTWQNAFVVDHLTLNSRWPRVAVRLWAALLHHVDWDTDEVLFQRHSMVERIGCQPRAINGVLAELVEFKALIAERKPEPGKQGRGTTRFWINPRVGTHRKEGRKARAAAAPSLGNVVAIDALALPVERRSRAPAVSLPVL